MFVTSLPEFILFLCNLRALQHAQARMYYENQGFQGQSIRLRAFAFDKLVTNDFVTLCYSDLK
jgi:hypothetical protein